MKIKVRQVSDFEDCYVVYVVDDKGKELIVPKEQCNAHELKNPSKGSLAYWKHYGFERDAINIKELNG